MPQKITPATEKDIPELDALVNSAYRGESSKKGWTTEADLLDGLRTNPQILKEMIAAKDAHIYCYRNMEDILEGCVYLQKKANELYIGLLTVKPTLQGAGIGKKLLAFADEQAKNKECAGLTMTVISVRTELIEWYQRHGYELTGETLPFPTDPSFGLPRRNLSFFVLKKKIL